MALSTLLKKATSLFGFTNNSMQPNPLDGEIIYSKNHVCVHPPNSSGRKQDHHPGYLSIHCKEQPVSNNARVGGKTLILTWIPNTMLNKSPQTMHKRGATSGSPVLSGGGSPCDTPRSESTAQGRAKKRQKSKKGDSGVESEMSKSATMENVIPKTVIPIASPPGQESGDSCISAVIPVGNIKHFQESEWELQNAASVLSCKPLDNKGGGAQPLFLAEHRDKSCQTPEEPERPKLASKLEDGIYFTSAPKIDYAAMMKDVQMETERLIMNLESSQDVFPELPPDTIYESENVVEGSESDASDVGPDDELSSDDSLTSYVKRNPIFHGNIEELSTSLAAENPNKNMSNFSQYSPGTRTPREQTLGVFSVDLRTMRSLRLFFSNDENTRGQLVIASRESQYKILHFHRGGLDSLAAILEDWNFLDKDKTKGASGESMYTQFSICRPHVELSERHPEEGAFNIVTATVWRSFVNGNEQIEDDLQLRKAVFFGGLHPSIRREAWPYLLHYYPFKSTREEREQIRNDMCLEYHNIRKKRENMTPDEREQFWRQIQLTVEKDVVRTDRAKPFFRGENNPNIEIMRNILLTYAVYNPVIGYTQGMSDLLAPVLTAVRNEVDTFWCFVGLMQGTIFVSSPKDTDMDKNLNYLRELLRVLLPKFYTYLRCQKNGLELLFCHRWLLLCFKREFQENFLSKDKRIEMSRKRGHPPSAEESDEDNVQPKHYNIQSPCMKLESQKDQDDALRMWEACWANYQTDYFHLFICAAIIAVYGKNIIEQSMPADETMQYFSSLAMHMRGDLVLQKARGLLFQYRQLPSIPCTLHGLCDLCGPGMWDSGHVPVIECTMSHGDLGCCPHGGIPPAQVDKAS